MARFSVIIPAYNEELYLPTTIAALRKAEAALGEPVEIVVGDNMSTDRTIEVAQSLGARTVQESTRCIGVVRNTAVKAATGDNLVFLDADDCMSENMLVEVRNTMDSGEYIGGGVAQTHYDRDTWGIFVTHGMLRIRLALAGISLFLMFCTKEAFETIGGYDPKRKVGEDFDLGVRLKTLGKQRGLKFKNIKNASLAKSARKFNEYGDWATFTHPVTTFKAILEKPDAIHEIWYKPRREPGAPKTDAGDSTNTNGS